MRFNHVHGLSHVVKAFGFSMQGLRSAWICEEAFRIEIILFMVLFPVALLFGNNAIERTILVGSLFLVLVVELLNSAVEAVVDRVSQEPHLLSARAKDIGSAAVFVSLLNAAVLWGLILLSKIG